MKYNGSRKSRTRTHFLGLNKGFALKFREGYRVRRIPEEGQREIRPKHCEYNNQDGYGDSKSKAYNKQIS